MWKNETHELWKRVGNISGGRNKPRVEEQEGIRVRRPHSQRQTEQLEHRDQRPVGQWCIELSFLKDTGVGMVKGVLIKDRMYIYRLLLFFPFSLSPFF